MKHNQLSRDEILKDGEEIFHLFRTTSTQRGKKENPLIHNPFHEVCVCVCVRRGSELYLAVTPLPVSREQSFPSSSLDWFEVGSRSHQRTMLVGSLWMHKGKLSFSLCGVMLHSFPLSSALRVVGTGSPML